MDNKNGIIKASINDPDVGLGVLSFCTHDEFQHFAGVNGLRAPNISKGVSMGNSEVDCRFLQIRWLHNKIQLSEDFV